MWILSNCLKFKMENEHMLFHVLSARYSALHMTKIILPPGLSRRELVAYVAVLSSEGLLIPKLSSRPPLLSLCAMTAHFSPGTFSEQLPLGSQYLCSSRHIFSHLWISRSPSESSISCHWYDYIIISLLLDYCRECSVLINREARPVPTMLG